MTITTDLTTIKMKIGKAQPFFGSIDMRVEPRDVEVKWISTGFYWLQAAKTETLPDIQFSIEPELLKKIVELHPNTAMSANETPFMPFYESMVWNRGMFVMGHDRILAYKKHDCVIIHLQHSYFGYPSAQIDQLVTTYDDLKKLHETLSDPALNDEKFICYTQMG